MSESQTNLAWDSLLQIAGDGAGPLHLRLTRSLRDAIRAQQIPHGSALPPSRQLAADLGCSRWVVTESYEQLAAEGYVEARVGSGTRVRAGGQEPEPLPRGVPYTPELPRFDLGPGLPDLGAFPRARWARASRDAMTSMRRTELAYPPPGGNPQLRRVLADYLRRVRGVVTDAEDVTITTGIVDGVTRVARTLLRLGHKRIAVENPSWHRLHQAVRHTGLEIVPIGVDDQGMLTDQLTPSVRAVIVSPAHQFPMGTVLAPRRRARLLDWARAVDGLILEDDYDAEFRYDRLPVGTVQGIEHARVVLLGSLSKTLSPALGLGWMITPPRWTEALRSSETRMTGPSTIEQLTLARFVETGGYDRHLRALRRRYRTRRDRVVAAVTQQLPGFQLSGAAAGLHLILGLRKGLRGDEVTAAAKTRGVRVMDLRRCRVNGHVPVNNREANGSDPDPNEALVLGYGNLDDSAVEAAVAGLADAIRALRA